MPTRPLIVCGADGVAVRVLEELLALGETVRAVVTDPQEPFGDAAAGRGIEPITGDPCEAATWERAGVAGVAAVALVDDDDVGNLHAALVVRELAPDVRLVLRLFNTEIASGVERLLPGAIVLSATELAAPAFVGAALSGNTGQRLRVAGHTLVVAEVDGADPDLVLALADPARPGEPFPEHTPPGHTVIGLVTVSEIPDAPAAFQFASRVRIPRPSDLIALADRRIAAVLAAVLVLLIISEAVFSSGLDISSIDALYFTVTTLSTTGYGDINLLEAPVWLKLYGSGLMIAGALTLALFFALFTDLVVSASIARTLGRAPLPERDHVIVCGLGKIGARAVRDLHGRGIPLVGVDARDDAPGALLARALRVPLVVADARTPGVLQSARLGSARALLAVTSDDVTNLECGLNALSAAPDVNVALRLYDPDLAERLDQAGGVGVSRSVAAVAAPAFAAALRDAGSVQTVPLTSRPLLVAEVTVAPGSPLDGRSIRDIETAHPGARVLVAEGALRPPPDVRITGGTRAALIGDRIAVDRVLRTTS